MSLIWDMLQESKISDNESVSVGSRNVTLPLQAHDRRRSVRTGVYVPLFVYGYAASREPFHEDTHTLEVSGSGGLLRLNAEVRCGQKLLLVNKLTQLERVCDVVHMAKRNKRTDVAISFPGDAAFFWSAERGKRSA